MKALFKLFLKIGDIFVDPAVFLAILGIVGIIALFAWLGGSEAQAGSEESLTDE